MHLCVDRIMKYLKGKSSKQSSRISKKFPIKLVNFCAPHPKKVPLTYQCTQKCHKIIPKNAYLWDIMRTIAQSIILIRCRKFYFPKIAKIGHANWYHQCGRKMTEKFIISNNTKYFQDILLFMFLVIQNTCLNA